MSMVANEPQGMANLDPKGMVGRINVGEHHFILYNTFPHYKSMGATVI